MTEKERLESFLTGFKELENELISLAKIKEEGHVSFSRALNEVYYKHASPLLLRYENYDFLKTASDLRNILSHENNICVPSEEYVLKFLSLKDSLLHPLTCYSICTKKIFSCTMEDRVEDCLKKMEYHSLSHLPLLDEDGCVQGVFSRSTLFDYLSMNESIFVDKETKISLFEEFLDLDEHLNERFLFVKRNERVDSVYPLLFKEKEHERNVSLLFVTEHGRRTEKLLGIITMTDLAKTKN